MPELNFTMFVLFSFPEAMVLAWLSLSLIGGRPEFYQILRIGLAQTLFDAFFFLYAAKLIWLPFGVHTVLQVVVLSGIIWRVMGISYKSSFLSVIFGFTVYVAIESFMLPLVISVTGHPMAVVNERNWLMRLPYHALELTINLTVILLIRRFHIWLMGEWFAEKNVSFWGLSGLLFTQTMLIIGICYQYYSASQEYLDGVGTIRFYFMAANGILPIITLVIIRQLINFARRDVEVKAQLDTFSQVEELLRTMRIQRHNFTHELQVVYGLLEVEEFQEARDYLKKSVSEVAATSELVKTDNLDVTALLYTKTGLAEARKIDLDIRVETNLKQFPLEARDINLVLGNLIDNAMEAVEGLSILERKVEVAIRQDLEGYVLEVKNYGQPIAENIADKIFEPGFSTKGEGRGLGLYSIQKLVHKYNGTIRVRSDSQDTCFLVVIPADQSRKQRSVKMSSLQRKWLAWLG